jgi:alcohol dehydrogenase class IV
MGNKAVELARACGADSDDFEGLYAWVITQLEALDIPNGLAALGVQSGDVERLASMAMNDGGMPTNPRPVSLAECQLFIADAMAKTW